MDENPKVPADEDRDIAEGAKQADDHAQAPATGYGGVIDTSQSDAPEEPDTFHPDPPRDG